MNRLDPFTEQLAAIPGAAGHVIVGPQGELLAHAAPDAEALAALLALAAQACRALGAELGSSGFHHLVLHRAAHGKLFLVPLGACTLGLLQKPNAIAAEVLARVLALKEAHAPLFG